MRLGNLLRFSPTLIIILLAGCAAPEQPEPTPDRELAVEERPTFRPATSHEASHGSEAECGSCGETQHHKLPELSFKEISEQIAKLNEKPLEEGNLPLETLLFHNVRATEYLDSVSVPKLDAEPLAFLERELARDHAIVAFRLVDEKGVERLTVNPTRVPLRERKHIRSSSTVNLQKAELSGTIVRVSIDRLWVRY